MNTLFILGSTFWNIIIYIVVAIIILTILVQIIGRLARFPIFIYGLSIVIGLVVGIYFESIWGGIGSFILTLIILGVTRSLIDD